ncbi:MAG TPA: Flp family type IVb pilin [Marmoricola sp.]|nr:Flp family type IVb pilin [Marmoricola sp.]
MALREDDGASAVEYGLLIAGIAALIVALIVVLGGAVFGLFDNSCQTIAGHISNASCSAP